jgi:diguanylate cyclase (GGDEF)-like protein
VPSSGRPSLARFSLFAVTWHICVWGGWALVAYCLINLNLHSVEMPGALILIAALLLLGELRPVVAAGRDPYGVPVSSAFVFAILFLWGLFPAIILQALATAIAETTRGKPMWKLLFNVGQYCLSVGGAWLVMLAFNIHPTMSDPLMNLRGHDIVWIVPAWIVYFVLNDAFVAGVSADTTQSFVESFFDDFWYYVVSTFAVLGLSPLVVIVTLEAWPLIPLLLLPMFAVYKTASISREKEHQSLHDSLTGLPNRKLLIERLGHALEEAQRSGDHVALFLLDLDRFKEVNDTLGHHVGDRLLELVASRITSAVRPDDTVARLGGDEFAVLLPTVRDVVAAVEVAGRVRSALSAPFHLEGMLLELEGSIGIALSPEHGRDGDELMRGADVAMYIAKEERTGIEAYRPDRDRNSASRLGTLGALRRAIDNGELELHYQPQVAIDTNEVVGVEALVRWRHPERGLVMPDDFIPMAETSGLMHKLTEYVIDASLAQVAEWERLGIAVPVAVNVSMRDLHGVTLAETVERSLERHGVGAELLQMEITERVLVIEPGRTSETLAALESLGVRLSLDDFGTGYSSLVMLKRLPVREVKIDQSFVRRLGDVDEDASIVRSIVDLSHALGLNSVAEGVETVAAWERLREMGCDCAQGWFIARPMPSEAATAWLLERETQRRPLRVLHGGAGAIRP